MPVSSGHAISIEHDAIPKVSHILPRNDIPDLLRVAWIGKPNSWRDEEMKRFASCKQLRIRTSVVRRWLHVLKAVNNLYNVNTIDDNDQIEMKVTDSIINNVSIFSNARTFSLERSIGSDITRGREQGIKKFFMYVTAWFFFYSYFI